MQVVIVKVQSYFKVICNARNVVHKLESEAKGRAVLGMNLGRPIVTNEDSVA